MEKSTLHDDTFWRGSGSHPANHIEQIIQRLPENGLTDPGIIFIVSQN
jgi:hypothetical protein